MAVTVNMSVTSLNLLLYFMFNTLIYCMTIYCHNKSLDYKSTTELIHTNSILHITVWWYQFTDLLLSYLVTANAEETKHFLLFLISMNNTQMYILPDVKRLVINTHKWQNCYICEPECIFHNADAFYGLVSS